MNYSVQQIKFECFSYIKEFGARMEDWVIGAASDPDSVLFGEFALDRTDDIWMWKPALSPAAARAVIDFMTSRYRLNAHPAPRRYPRALRVHVQEAYRRRLITSRSSSRVEVPSLGRRVPSATRDGRGRTWRPRHRARLHPATGMHSESPAARVH